MENKRKNILITVLFYTLKKTNKAIILQKSEDEKMLEILKEALNFANTELKDDSIIYSDLTKEEAEQEIKILDSLYFALSSIFNMLFLSLSKVESEEIKKEYNKLIDNMEDLREGLELYTDETAMQRLTEIAKGDFSNFTHVA